MATTTTTSFDASEEDDDATLERLHGHQDDYGSTAFISGRHGSSIDKNVEDVTGTYRTLDEVPESWYATDAVPRIKFSRYFLRQILVTIKIKPSDADDAVTSLKLQLEKEGINHLTLRELERRLFDFLDKPQYFKPLCLDRFHTVCRFQSSRGAFVIFVFGTPCFKNLGTSIRLAELINVPNIVRTNIVANVLSFPEPFPSLPQGDTEQDVLENFKAMCRTVRKGLNGDLDKARVNGKSVVVDGLLIDPALYEDVFCSEMFTNTANSKYPVVVVPIMLQQKLIVTAEPTNKTEKTLRTIEGYLQGFTKNVHVIDVIESQHVNEMHYVILQELQRHYDMRAF